MKKFGILFAGAFAFLTLASCNDDENEINKEEEYDDSYYAAQATVTSSDSNFTASSDGGTINFKTEGGTVMLNISCGCDWTADNEAADLFTTSVTSTTLTVTAGQNTVEEELTGTVIVKTSNEGIVFATITVTQNAYGAPEISVETNEWNAPAKGALTAEISVEATADWTAESADAWLTVVKTDTGISLTADENGETTERSTKVTITCTDGVRTEYEYIAVSQDGRAYITLSDEILTLPGNATSATVAVETNFEDWSYDKSDDWITVVRDGNALTVSVDINEGESRNGTVTLTTGDGAENVAEAQLTVTQYGVSDMVLTYTITSANTSTQLPLDGTVDCTVDWGDGSDVETITSTQPSHTYAVTGEYDIIIKGTVTALRSNNISTASAPLPITAVRQWGKTGLTDMQFAFFYCSNLVSVPDDTAGAFANVTSFYRAFIYCSALEKIPAGMFDGCSEVTTFYWVFSNCQSLKKIPEEGIFNGCTGVTTSFGAFQNCTSITEIPEGLFDDFTEVTTFAQVFLGCTSLVTIPKGLFDKCEKVTTFGAAFSGCSSVMEIPEGLFDNCPEVTTFSNSFVNCTSLTTVPVSIFSKNTKATTFSGAFNGDAALTGESPYDTIDGVKVHLYERENYTDVYSKPGACYNCFTGCTKLDDYNDIPSSWGGGGK